MNCSEQCKRPPVGRLERLPRALGTLSSSHTGDAWARRLCRGGLRLVVEHRRPVGADPVHRGCPVGVTFPVGAGPTDRGPRSPGQEGGGAERPSDGDGPGSGPGFDEPDRSPLGGPPGTWRRRCAACGTWAGRGNRSGSHVNTPGCIRFGFRWSVRSWAPSVHI